MVHLSYLLAKLREGREVLNKLQVYKSVAARPLTATQMLWNHRRTLKYLWKRDRRSFWSHVFTTYFVRGEDCGKGVLDPLWKLTGRAPFLWDLELETTTACYLKCVHCEHTYWKDKSYLNQHLTPETLKSVIDSIPNLRWMNLTGEGTSVLNPQFMSLVREVKRRGIYLDFSHDFVKLDKDHARQWVEFGVDRVYWSIDGVSEGTYEKIRVGARFKDVLANVKRLIAIKKELKSPLPEICFRYTFFRSNFEELPLLPSFLRTLVENVKDYGDEPSINIVALLEFEETKDWAVEVPQGYIDCVDSESELYGFKNYWSHVTHVESEKAPMDYCTFWSEPYIMITGHVVPCCAVLMSNKREELERLSFGNIHELSLREIWNTKHYKRFRKMVVNPRARVPTVCVGCRAFNTETRREKYGHG